MNRKGFIGDVPIVLAVLLVLGITVFVGYKFFVQFNNEYQDGIASDVSKGLLQNSFDRYANLWDGIFMLVFGLFAVALMISVATLGTRPEFFFVTIIIGFFIIGASAIVSNAFYEVSEGLGVESSFTFIPLVMNNLVNITLVLVALLVTGLYVKIRGYV